MREGIIEISEFSLPPVSPSVTGSRAVMSAGAAIASVLIHLALLAPIVWAGGQHVPQRHRELGSEASKLNRSDEIALQLIAIDDRTIDRDPQPSALPPPQLTQIRLNPELTEFSVDFPVERSDPASSSETTYEAANARLRGQWMGQISARIDRAWLRPRSPIGDERFRCQVRIEQDPAGYIKEVALESCNGSSRWQLSLVHAIEAASPLPAPPAPAVFARAMHMSFQAVPVELAISLDQYEVDTSTHAQVQIEKTASNSSISTNHK